MNKRLATKRETLTLIQKRIEEHLQENDLDSPEIPQTLEQKYLALHKQIHRLEKIYHFYKSIIQGMSSGLMTIDRFGEITFLNQIAAKTLGYNPDELRGRKIYALFPKVADAEAFLKLVTIEGKKFDGHEIRLVHKSGQDLTVGISTSPLIDEPNGHQGVIILLKDLTERKLLQQQIQRVDRLSKLSEVTSGIAHEIRNPLGGIKSCAQLLEEGLKPEDPLQESVKRIIKQVDRANALLKEFFKFAQPARPQLKYVDIEVLIDEMYLLMSPQMQEASVIFKENFEAIVPKVYVDEMQIQQVIMNLFLNALQAMPEGGTLQVNTRTVIVNDDGQLKNMTGGRLESVLPMVAVDIADTGIGISKENMEKIFDPFFTTRSEGVGLGLSISTRFVSENGGKIDVKSDPGKGSTFTLVLPTR